MKIEIPNWDKYNPRNDAKRWSWFRFENDFFDDESLCDLTGTQKLLLVYLFTRRNKAATLIFSINPRHAAQRTDISPEDIVIAIEAIASAKIIRIHPDDPNVSVRGRTDPYAGERMCTLRTDVTDVTDVTDETNVTNETDDPLNSDLAADLALASQWLTYAREVTPSIRVNLQNWAGAVRLLRERDGVSRLSLAEMLEFVRGDDFWRDKALSLEGLRKPGRNGLRKFENIRNRMGQEPKRESDDDWVARKERELAEGRLT